MNPVAFCLCNRLLAVVAIEIQVVTGWGSHEIYFAEIVKNSNQFTTFLFLLTRLYLSRSTDSEHFSHQELIIVGLEFSVTNEFADEFTTKS